MRAVYSTTERMVRTDSVCVCLGVCVCVVCVCVCGVCGLCGVCVCGAGNGRGSRRCVITVTVETVSSTYSECVFVASLIQLVSRYSCHVVSLEYSVILVTLFP
jgi:hypothetical protein